MKQYGVLVKTDRRPAGNVLRNIDHPSGTSPSVPRRMFSSPGRARRAAKRVCKEAAGGSWGLMQDLVWVQAVVFLYDRNRVGKFIHIEEWRYGQNNRKV